MASIDDYDLNTKTEFSRRALCPKDDKFCEDVQCKWVCTQNAECKMESRPVCDVPKCRVICDPPKTPQCTVRTSAPVCKTVCKKIDGCYYNVMGLPLSKFYMNYNIVKRELIDVKNQ